MVIYYVEHLVITWVCAVVRVYTMRWPSESTTFHVLTRGSVGMSVEAVAINSIGTFALWPAATTWHVPLACFTVVLKATVKPRVSRAHTFFL